MRLSGLVFRNLRRHKRSFAFSVVGIVLGVSSFVAFLGLGQGLRRNVLEEVFVVDQVEVVPKRYQMGGIDYSGSLFGGGTTGLDDYTLDDLGALPGVVSVFPKMQLSFPSMAWGGEAFFGQNFATEFMADGVPGPLIQGELGEPADQSLAFTDWDLDRDLPIDCSDTGLSDAAQWGCPEGMTCGADGICEGHPYTCDPDQSDGRGLSIGCPPGRFCTSQGICERQPCDPDDEVLSSESEGLLRAVRTYVRQNVRRGRARADIREVEEGNRLPGMDHEYRLAVNRTDVDETLRKIPDFLVDWAVNERLELALFRANRALQTATGQRPRRRQRAPVLRDATLLTAETSRGCDDPPSYCAIDSRVCEVPIPVVASPFLMEIYNTSVQNVLTGSERSLPPISAELLVGFTFNVRLGRGYLGQASQFEETGSARRSFRIVGWTPRAMRLGVTIPFSYARRFNSRYHGEDSAGEYHSILVVTGGSEQLASIVARIEDDPDDGGLGLAIGAEYEQAKRGSLLITLLTVGLLFISGLIIGLASLNIAHTFLMVVAERRRELGVLRSVGARRTNILYMVLAEATVIGVLGASLGVLLALGGATVADRLLECRVPAGMGLEQWCIPDFPFKPDSFFAFDPIIIVAGFGVAIGFSILGAFVPAWRASRVDPAEALRAH